MPSKKSFTNVAERIVERSVPIDKFLRCGVYFLIKDEIVVYVGKSTSVDCRIKQHLGPKGIPFDRVYFFQTPLHKLTAFEEHFIKTMKPKYNLSFSVTSPEVSMNMNDIRKQFKIGPDVVTPDGYFASVDKAAHHHGISRQSVYGRIKSGWDGWSYFSEYDYPNPRSIAMRRGRPRNDP